MSTATRIRRALHWWIDLHRSTAADLRQTRLGTAVLALCLLVWLWSVARLFVLVLDWIGWAR